MRRRTFVRGVGGGSVAGIGLAGCLTRTGEDEDPIDEDGPLRVASYTSMAAGGRPAGRWLGDAFEDATEDATVEWTIPESGIDHYIQRARYGAAIDADVYLGLTAGELAIVDDALAPGQRLFESLDRERLEHDGRVRDDLGFEEPHDRVVPFDTGYVTLVRDGTAIDPPEAFDELRTSAYDASLLVQDPRRSDPGRAFLWWTVAAYGDDYLSFWRDLRENDVHVLESWTDAYDAYVRRERPMVVSYSTDRVGANAADRDLRRHRITPLDERGYENTEGVAVFSERRRPDLAYEFVDFVLSSRAQAEIAARNVQFPAVERQYVDLEDAFLDHAREPPETVTATYDDLRGELRGRLEDWSAEMDG
ncbi:thiamine ABC transporter substrate-binding protein [Halopiger djelfimassiliensis]|uniref:thiamine ABC transporter substrate-binding protein n=1 Tax=Halopiger djelfimassiliensis TaxID=1293047 RepID=UPI000677B1DF|nr:thiamine ABC transporter substrate-binding protein [Halopiger djelfimassiliensis]